MTMKPLRAKEAYKIAKEADKLEESRNYVHAIIVNESNLGETAYIFDKFNTCYKDLRALEPELTELGYEVEFYTIGDDTEVHCMVSWDIDDNDQS